MEKGFICIHCDKFVSTDKQIGTNYRNHCPFCLWSKHAGLPNDKVQPCQGTMEPIGLTFKNEGWNKYTKKPKQGEIMVVHRCQNCGKISINRIASDDSPNMILQIFEVALIIDQQTKNSLFQNKIKLLDENDRQEVQKQLYGNLTELH